MGPFQSQIRDSTKNALLEKVAKHNYGQYLLALTLKKVRGFSDAKVRFEFPVTALIGPNGGGKTTILGAAGIGFKAVPPRLYFAKSGKFDDSMQDWSIEYEAIDRTVSKQEVIRRTSTYKSLKWDRDALDRTTLSFGISRTIPASERAELKRCISNKFDVPDSQITALSDSVRKSVSAILGKSVDSCNSVRIDETGRITMLTGKTAAKTGYSEFHFGAGESSIIRMVMAIEAAAENSLVLIEEIENGLHPVATIAMVEYLVEVADRKKAQVIFTTHSNDALKPLPSQAIWAAVNNKVFQGKLDVHALRAITGQIDARLAVFAEDDYASHWIRAVVRTSPEIAHEAISIHALAGDGTAVTVNRHHNQDPSIGFPSICFIDGDSKQQESDVGAVFRLPGTVPESYIFDRALEAEQYAGKLAVALLQRFEEAVSVVAKLKEVRMKNKDPHILFSQAGEVLGLVPEQSVVHAFVTIWAQAYPEEAATILQPLQKALMKHHDVALGTSK